MLNFFYCAATFMLIFLIGNSAVKIDPEIYTRFLSSVKDYCKFSGIFFIYGDNTKSKKPRTIHPLQPKLMNLFNTLCFCNSLCSAKQYSHIREAILGSGYTVAGD